MPACPEYQRGCQRQHRQHRSRQLLGCGIYAVVLTLLAMVTQAPAGEFDGSKPLRGSTERIIEINQHRIMDNVDADAIGLPKRFVIDFATRTMRPSKDSIVRRSVQFNRPVHIEDMLIIQGVDEGVEGVDDGVAWSLTISKTDGRSVLSASKNGMAYVVLGTCSAIREKK